MINYKAYQIPEIIEEIKDMHYKSNKIGTFVLGNVSFKDNQLLPFPIQTDIELKQLDTKNEAYKQNLIAKYQDTIKKFIDEKDK